jgi:hypothetical protein
LGGGTVTRMGISFRRMPRMLFLSPWGCFLTALLLLPRAPELATTVAGAEELDEVEGPSSL